MSGQDQIRQRTKDVQGDASVKGLARDGGLFLGCPALQRCLSRAFLGVNRSTSGARVMAGITDR
jgi:hypothetical protein